MIKKENMFLVINEKFLDEYWSQYQKGVFVTDEEQKFMDSLTFKEVMDELEKITKGKKYIVCNQDEPYAERVWQTILDGEALKELAIIKPNYSPHYEF